jgi:hypothetical protein
MNALKLIGLVATGTLLAAAAAAQENYDTCATDFTAVEPNGTAHHNIVEFDAVPAQGGVLCTNGRWRARDGSASGTTPFRVFIKDGVRRGSP